MKKVQDKLAEKVNEISETNPDEVKEENSFVLPEQKEDLQIFSIVPEFAITLHEARERIAMLQSFVKEMMIPNIDYGLIPKCTKPSLFKPGAEKLCDIFGFSKQITILNRVEDWKEGIFHYEVKAILVSKRNGLIEAEGIGSCNSKEKKYKESDPFSIVNTILKMAKKRAFVDAVLSATRSSGIFTQDIVDDEGYSIDPSQSTSSQNAKSTPISKNQLTAIFTLVAQKKIPVTEIKAYISQNYNVTESKHLNEDQAKNFIEYLKTYKARQISNTG